MSSNVFSLIRTKYNSLSESQKGIADYVLNHGDKVMLSSLSDLAYANNVSETTVIRFLHKLNYDSYQVFRVHIAQELSQDASEALYDDVTENDSVKDIMEKVLQATTESLKNSAQIINIHQLEKLIDLIMKAKKILIIGVGATAAIAFDFQHKLLKLGIEVSCCNDPHIINIRCLNLTPEDLLIAISHSGESREILDGVQFAKQQRCPVACITSYPNSNLAKRAFCTVLSSSQETQYRSDAMISRIIQLTIIDMVYVSIAIKMGNKAIDRVNRSRLAVAKNKT